MQSVFDFDGKTYSADFDRERLNAQCRRVFDVMRDGLWRTLSEIGMLTGDPQASVSARLRDFRKAKFGGFVVERRARGDRGKGLFEYRVLAGKGNGDGRNN